MQKQPNMDDLCPLLTEISICAIINISRANLRRGGDMRRIRRILFHAAHIVMWVANIIIWSKTCSITGVESAAGLLSLGGIMINTIGLIVALLDAHLAYKQRRSHSQSP